MKYLGQRGSTLRKLAAVAAIINGAILTLVTFEFYKLGGGENRFAIGNILRWNYLEIEFAPEEGGKRRRFPSETRAFKGYTTITNVS